jgi:hypothetical protein
MVRKLEPGDFRAHRKILESDDFALSDGEPDPPPSDLISQEAWDGIMVGPDDVAIRTTSHQGDRVAFLHELWGGWVEYLPAKGILADAVLDVSDDFSASLFNLVHGYYKQAIAALRNALETMVVACVCELKKDATGWSNWFGGEEVKFADVHKKLAAFPKIAAYENEVRKVAGIGMFINTKEPKNPNWIRNLYSRLSSFSHAQGDTTNSALWESNGPVYSASGMRSSYHFYLETYVVALLLARLARDNFEMPKEARIIFDDGSLSQFLDRPVMAVCKEYVSSIYTEG